MSDWSSIPRGDRPGRPGTWSVRTVVEVYCPWCYVAVQIQPAAIDSTGTLGYELRCVGTYCTWTQRVSLEDFAGEVVT